MDCMEGPLKSKITCRNEEFGKMSNVKNGSKIKGKEPGISKRNC